MKKFLVIVLTIVFMFSVQTVFAAQSKTTKAKKLYTEREFSVQTRDGHLIRSYLSYPKTKMKGYPTIIMLHALGYNSTYWIALQEKYNAKGYAVLRIDLRGHGKSVYDKSFHQRSWRNFKNKDFEQYPNDVIQTIQFIEKQTKKPSFVNYAIVGSDIGANTAVIVARKMNIKHRALVLLAPSMEFKGLYIPVVLTEIGKTPILALASKTDKYYKDQQVRLARFAQGTFDVANADSGNSGMLILKQHPEFQNAIVTWTEQYFKNAKAKPSSKKKN